MNPSQLTLKSKQHKKEKVSNSIQFSLHAVPKKIIGMTFLKSRMRCGRIADSNQT